MTRPSVMVASVLVFLWRYCRSVIGDRPRFSVRHMPTRLRAGTNDQHPRHQRTASFRVRISARCGRTSRTRSRRMPRPSSTAPGSCWLDWSRCGKSIRGPCDDARGLPGCIAHRRRRRRRRPRGRVAGGSEQVFLVCFVVIQGVFHRLDDRAGADGRAAQLVKVPTVFYCCPVSLWGIG